jgi:hypothetical protein
MVASKLAPTGLVLACAGVLAWSLLRADAAWQFFAAETITQGMYEGRQFTPAGLEAAEMRVNRALARFSGNPDFRDLAGRLQELRAHQPGVLGQERREQLEAAAENHRRALASRPLWPYSWANLLSAKDKLGQVDAEFNAALHRAAATGPWEPRVQLQLIRSGVRNWDELRRPERALVRARAAEALRVQPRDVFEIARFYARPDLVCGADSGQPQIERWCQNVL